MALIRAEELGEDVEDKPAKEGEYDLRILKSEYGPNKKQTGFRTALFIRIEGADGEGVLPFNHYLSDITDADDSAAKRRKIRDIKRFCAVFGIPIDGGIDLENQSADFVGQTGKCFVRQETGDDDVVRNTLRLPKLD